MKRLTVSLAFLALPVGLTAITGCSTQECLFLNDCPSSQMCSPEGTCISDDRPAIPARNGAGENLPGNGGPLGNQGVGIGDVTTPGDATLTGSIGPVSGFDGPAVLSVWNDVDFGLTFIDVTANSEQGYGLFILNLAGGVASLPAGTTTIGPEGYEQGTTFAQLCSDTEDGSVHFDGIPEETVVTVTPDDEGVNVEVESTITNGWDEWSYDGAEPTVVRVAFRLLR